MTLLLKHVMTTYYCHDAALLTVTMCYADHVTVHSMLLYCSHDSQYATMWSSDEILHAAALVMATAALSTGT